jgi:hypothetical protein
MSTLSVSAIQNTASPATNVVLNADGSSTVALYNAAIAPSPVQTGTLWYDISGAGLVIWDGASWVGVGGGGGLAAATLAQAAAGTLNTVALTPESGVPKDAAGMAGAALLPGSGAAYVGTPATGMIRFNNSTPPATIEYYDGTTWQTIPTTTGGGLGAATLAQAAAGTSNAVALTPESGVPKDASGMTGAAILPSGTDAQRTAIATPTTGMMRVNTDSDAAEFYDGTRWVQLAEVPPPPSPLSDLIPANGDVLPLEGSYNNIVINAGVTVTVLSSSVLRAYGDITVNGTINADGRGWPGPYTNGSNQAATVGSGPGAGSRAGNGGGYQNSYIGLLGSSGGQGATVVTTPLSNGGGYGGGGIYLSALGSISVGATAVITANGGNGIRTGGGGGGGGGSGGSIRLEASGALNIAAGALLSVVGGNGATGSGAGAGGGGGGGGWIVLSGTVTNAGTMNVSGGLGATGGGTTETGAGGGTFAGLGGIGGYAGKTPAPATSGENGDPGIVLVNGI